MSRLVVRSSRDGSRPLVDTRDATGIAHRLTARGVEFARWAPAHPVPDGGDRI